MSNKFSSLLILTLSIFLTGIKTETNKYSIINLENIQEYNFTINNTNQFLIFRYFNDIPDNNYDLIFRLSELYSFVIPEVYVSMTIYYSSTDSPEIIKQDTRNKFIDYLYKCENIRDFGTQKEIWFNPSTDDLKYINKGYYYAVINFENIEPDDIFVEFSSSIIVFNTYIIPEIKTDEINLFDFGHDYKIPMVFKIPSTYDIDNIRCGVKVHTPLKIGLLTAFYFSFYEESNPRTNKDLSPSITYNFASFKSERNLKIKIETDYYLQYRVSNYNGQYGNTLFLHLIKNTPIEVKIGNVYTVTSFKFLFLTYCFLKTDSITVNTKMFFHVYNSKDFDFSYSTVHLNNEQIYLNENDYDDFIEHFDNYATDLYFQYSENIFLGKGLYYIEMFYSIPKKDETNMLLFAEYIVSVEFKRYVPLETNIEFINMNQIKDNYNNKYTKTNGKALYFYIDVNELSDEYKNKNILIYTNNNYNLNVYESYVNEEISEIEKISNIYENRKLVHIKSQYNNINIKNHSIIFSCKNDDEDFNLEVKFMDNNENLLINQNYYLIKNETLERNIINNSYTDIYFINTYHELINTKEYLTYYSCIISDFEIKFINLDKYNEANMDNLIDTNYNVQNKYSVNAKNPFEENSKGELIYMKRKNSVQRNIYYFNRINCKNYDQSEIKYGDFWFICLKQNEKTKLKLDNIIKNTLKYGITTEGISNVLNNANIALYYNNNLLHKLTDFGISEYGELAVNDGDNYFTLENNGNQAMLISFKIGLLNNEVIYFNQSLYKFNINNDLLIFNIKDTINNKEQNINDYFYQDINFKTLVKRKQIKYCIYELFTSYNYLTYPPEISCSYDSDKFSDYITNIYSFNELYTKKKDLSTNINDFFYYMIVYIENEKLYNNSILLNNQYEYKINLQNNINEKLITNNLAAKQSIITFELPKYSSNNKFDSIAFQLICEYNKKNYDIVLMINDEIITNNITDIQYDPINYYGNIILNNHEMKNITLKLLSNNNDVLKIKEYNSKDIDYIFKPNFTEINVTQLKNYSVMISFIPYEEGIHNYDIYFVYKNIIDEYEKSNKIENGSYLFTFSNIFNLNNIKNSICNTFSVNNFNDNNITNFIFDANCERGEIYVLVYSTQVNYFNFINYYKPNIIVYSSNNETESKSIKLIVIIACIFSFLLICIISFIVFKCIKKKKELSDKKVETKEKLVIN